MTEQVCKEWRAVRRGEDLIVAGACEFPRDGYTVRVNVGNQGINPNPRILRLDLDVKAPEAGPDVLSTEIAIGIFQNRGAEAVVIDQREVPVEKVSD